MSEKIIEFKNVNKWYGKFHVLKDINLFVNKGEKIIICGPSGSGKSTLIRCINGLEQHQDGNIIVEGIELDNTLKNIDKIRGDVGMVFQQFNLFPHLTILDNCALAPAWVKKITDALNFHLKNESISILKTETINDDFDARRDAKLRIYKYVIINRDSPLSIEKDRAWQLKIKLDEIDTGIAGEAARQVGLLLKELAQHRQVVCITHQPQIAGKAHTHFFVYKQAGLSNTAAVQTGLRLLSPEERVEIIAQMIGGEHPTPAALANARELLS